MTIPFNFVKDNKYTIEDEGNKLVAFYVKVIEKFNRKERNKYE